MDSPEFEALAGQIDDLVTLVDELSEDDFVRPTRCPGWSVRELVAHCEGMLVRLVGANADPFPGEPATDRVGYYRYDPDGPRDGEDPARTFSEVIRDRVIEEAGDRTSAQIRSDLHAAAERAIERIHEIPADRVIRRSGHPPMSYGEFVASRNLELGVHAMDIADATGRPPRVSPAAGSIIIDILDGLLGQPIPETLGWSTEVYILAGTGRRPLTPSERAGLGAAASRFPLLR